jgi:hypothetical protein
MGLFDIFKSSKERKTFGTLHGMDLREWNDGYKSDEKSIIKFVKKKLDSMSSKEFLNFLKKRDLYRKFVYQEANETMNKISVTEPKGISSLGLTKLGFSFFPSAALEQDMDINSFRIVDTEVTYEKKRGMKFEKSKTLIILSLDRKQKYLDFWKKKLSWGKSVHYIGFQFVDLDEDEYKFLKPFENKLMQNSPKLYDTWNEFIDVAHKGLFATEKRKAYPINRFQTYLVFEE